MNERRFTYHRYYDDLGNRMVDVRDSETVKLVMRMQLPDGFDGLRPEDMPALEEQLRRAFAKRAVPS